MIKFPKSSGARILGPKHNSLVVYRFLASNTQRFVLPLEGVFLRIISLLGEKHASTLLDHLKDHVCSTNEPVMVIRAGDGLLAKKLLEAGIRNLHVFERRNAFRPTLQNMASQYPGRCTYYSRTFNEIFFDDSTIPVFNSPYLKASFPFECKRKWEEGPSVKIICSHVNGKVLLVGLAHISKNMMHCGMGRPQLFLTIPRSPWNKLLEDPLKVNYQDYQRAGLLFPDFYDFEELGTISPPVQYSTGEIASRSSKEEFVTISITPKKELGDYADAQLLEEYLFFGTQTMNGKAKHGFVIQTLEKWAPGSGKMLVANKVDCFTRFKDLSAQEALRIYKLWRNASNFNSSLFMHEYNNYMRYGKQ